MVEIILLSGAISVELEPYAVENPETDTYSVETNTDVYRRPFQWTTRHNKSGNSILLQDNDESNGYMDGIERDVFGRPLEAEK